MSLAWYENYKIGRYVAGALLSTAGMGLVAITLVGSPDRSMKVGQMVICFGSLVGGLYFWNKSYSKDPYYRSKIIEAFWKRSFRASINSSGWEELTEIVPFDDIRSKVSIEIGEAPTLRSIWNAFDHDIVINCLQRNIIPKDTLHRLCLEEIDVLGFDNMHKTYRTWWLDHGVVEPHEIGHHFANYFDTVTDIILFFDTYMKWPVLKYQSSLGIHPDRLAVLKQVYETYSLSKKSFEDRERQIIKEYSTTREHYDEDYTIAYQKYRDRVNKLESKLALDPLSAKKMRDRVRQMELEWDAEERHLRSSRELKLIPLESKKDKDLTILKANWREIQNQIKMNWSNYLSGRPMVVINTAFAASTQIMSSLPAATTAAPQVTVVINNNQQQQPATYGNVSSPYQQGYFPPSYGQGYGAAPPPPPPQQGYGSSQIYGPPPLQQGYIPSHSYGPPQQQQGYVPSQSYSIPSSPLV